MIANKWLHRSAVWDSNYPCTLVFRDLQEPTVPFSIQRHHHIMRNMRNESKYLTIIRTCLSLIYPKHLLWADGRGQPAQTFSTLLTLRNLWGPVHTLCSDSQFFVADFHAILCAAHMATYSLKWTVLSVFVVKKEAHAPFWGDKICVIF